jgi:ribosomal protein L16 Arg81 hydroxylase
VKKTRDIDRIRGISRDQFFEKYFEKEPVILEGHISDWPAVNNWSPEYLVDKYGDVMIWLSYYDPESQKSPLAHHIEYNIKQVKLREYIESLQCGERCFSLREDEELFETIPELLIDLNHGRPFVNEEALEEDEYKGLWFAGTGHVTALHVDVGEGHLFQLYGEKRFNFYAPDQTPYLYQEDAAKLDNPELKERIEEKEIEAWRDYMKWSEVNVLRPDFEKFPLLKKVEFSVADIRAGDVIYVPDGWWHTVESLSATISVTAGLQTQLFLAKE